LIMEEPGSRSEGAPRSHVVGEEEEEDLDLEPSLRNLLEKESLKWIFVGGKGGVGKTTTSCSVAIQLAKVRKNVLIISTDPAHNLSDAFGQKFTAEPTKVQGFDNLFAMEVDPQMDPEKMENHFQLGGMGGAADMIQDLMGSLPGIDEAVSFAEVMKLVKSMAFSTIVFDTAPTGHTLRLLSFPTLLDKGIGKLVQFKSRLGPLFSSMAAMFNLPENEDMSSKMENLKEITEQVNTQFKDPDLTTFVCVCIPEFLSLYETERLVQELNRFEIDTQNIVINQVIYPQKRDCELCIARARMQKKYIDQIQELYEDFHVVKMPLLKEEIRGLAALTTFSEMLVHPQSQSS